MHPFKATHHIFFHPLSGPVQTIDVMFLGGAAYTRVEWDTFTTASIFIDASGAWSFQGHPTPGGVSGTVWVRVAPWVAGIIRRYLPGKSNASARSILHKGFQWGGIGGLTGAARGIAFRPGVVEAIVSAIEAQI